MKRIQQYIKMLLTMGWRNISRNKKRTAILVSAGATGVIGILLTASFMNAFILSTLETSYMTGLGHLQVRPAGYMKSRKMSLLLEQPAVEYRSLQKELAGMPTVQSSFSVRLDREAVVQLDTRTAGVMMLGVDPQSEKGVSRYHEWIKAGRYLEEADSGGPAALMNALIGQALAEKFAVREGDYLVASFSDYNGRNSSVRLQISGIFNSPAVSIDKTMILVPRRKLSMVLNGALAVDDEKPADYDPALQNGSRVSAGYFVALLEHQNKSPQLKTALSDWADKHKLEVMDHVDLEPNMSKMLEFSNSMMFIFYFILMTGFGLTLFNTVMMSVLERTYELGVMTALGTPRRTVFNLVMTESTVLSLLGCSAGLVVGGLITGLLSGTGINMDAFSDGLAMMGPAASVIRPSLSFRDLTDSLAITMVVSVVASIYPAFKAARMKPVDALQMKK